MIHDSNATKDADDVWSRWVLGRRHGGDPAYQHVVQGRIERVRDRVLDGARLVAGMTLVDVGAGDGLIAFGAIARIGPSLRVVLTDLSAPLLRYAAQRARACGVHAQCTFLEGAAEELTGLDDATVDVVTTRAVLAYVADKSAALREFWRVLKPGGRISLAEPIFRDQAFEAGVLTQFLIAAPAQPQTDFLRLLQRWKAAQFPATEEEIRLSPLANYTERDLLRFVRIAGFGDIHLELHIDVQPSSVTTWNVFLDVSPHPWAPPLRAILADRFSQEERQLFERILRPQIESGQMLECDAIAYLTAGK